MDGMSAGTTESVFAGRIAGVFSLAAILIAVIFRLWR
jgi:hypothetical protein